MFRIGEFSKIAQVAGSQLRYYDEIGLLKPAKIDEWTGYRYYSAQQIPELNRILALREMGLSLDQIRRMLNEAIAGDEIRGMFALRKAQVEQSIQEDILRLRMIEARLKQLDEGDEQPAAKIVVKTVPAQHYLSLREKLSSFGVAAQLMAVMNKAIPAKLGSKRVGQFVAILHDEMYGEPQIDLEMGFVMNDPVADLFQLSAERTMRLSTLPPVETMVTSVRLGLPQTSHLCRASMANWVETNGYEFAGKGREIFLVPPVPGREAETVLEIQFPVRLREDSSVAA